jgi:23S rRNA G2445 N2-methylase RlmL
MTALPHLVVNKVAYRRVEATCDDVAVLAHLRTVDDVFIKLETWGNVGHQRSELARFTALSSKLDLDAAVAILKGVRPIQRLNFSVTANFVGQRNYSASEIKASAADGVLSRFSDWRYVEDDDAAEINLRIFIEHERAWVGMRLGRYPLHRRPYKQAHLPGSLKPPVAAAMAHWAQVGEGTQVLDPFCGGGTILIESALLGASVMGGDLNAAAVATARENMRSANIHARLETWHAAALPCAAASVDCVISNLPWGKQVPVDAHLKALYAAAVAEMQRVVVPTGSIVLLTAHPELLGVNVLEQIEISLYGQTPKMVRLTN